MGAWRNNKKCGIVGASGLRRRTGIAYAPQGDFSQLSFGNGLAQAYSYNQRMQPSEVKYTQSGQTNYALDLVNWWGIPPGQTTQNNGNLQATQENTYVSGAQINMYTGYTYDGVNRLTLAQDGGNAWSRGFGYDPYGNMWVSSATGIPANSLTPTSNGYSSSTNRLGGNSYDAAGNLTSFGVNTIGYDAESRQISVSNTSPGMTTTYTYDGLGERVMRFINNVRTNYVYDAMGQLSAEYDGTPPVVPPCTTCFLSLDHLGSTRLVTDQNDNVVARHDYLPFGEEMPVGVDGRTSTGSWDATDLVTQKFTGKERDPESGLDYFGARYYGSALGRFTSPDWSATPEPVPYANLSNPQTLNLYAYVENNPLSITDLDGHGWWGDFWNGLANSTYRPLVTFVEHPIVTGRNLGSAITHPIATANAIKNGVVTTTFSAVKGNGEAIGTAVGTVGMAFIPGAGEAGETAEAASDLSKVGEAGGTVADLNKSCE